MAETAGRVWRGRTPAERQAARRHRLLDAALQAFGTAGFAATSTASLCASAQVSTKHFYELFDDREAVLLTLYDQLLGELVDRMVAALDAAPPDRLAERVAAALDAVLRYQTDDPRRARVLHLEVLGVSPTVERRRHLAIRAFADLVTAERQRLVDAGLLAPRDFALLATALVGAADESVVSWLLADPRPEVDRVHAALCEIFTATFASTPPDDG